LIEQARAAAAPAFMPLGSAEAAKIAGAAPQIMYGWIVESELAQAPRAPTPSHYGSLQKRR
jgi:hypothetical protein